MMTVRAGGWGRAVYLFHSTVFSYDDSKGWGLGQLRALGGRVCIVLKVSCTVL